MKKRFLSLLVLSLTLGLSAQQGMPDWFRENMEASVGIWITDNSAYKSQQEPFDRYVMDWEWGLGKQSITGIMYGMIDGKKQGTFWEFRQYWDYGKGQGMVVQYAGNGTVGMGPLTGTDGKETELVQDFTTPEGRTTRHGHRSSLENGILITTSYDIDPQGGWNKRRTYSWVKSEP